MLERAVDGLHASGVIDTVVVVAGSDCLDRAQSLVGAVASVVSGGAERTDSVRAGLAAVGDADWILVHDAARPLTPPDMIARVVEHLRDGHRAVIPAIAVADTIREVDSSGRVRATPDRAALRAIQTPQGFSADVIRRAYADAVDATTDDAALVERLGESLHLIEGDRLAFKITTPLDRTLAEAILSKGQP